MRRGPGSHGVTEKQVFSVRGGEQGTGRVSGGKGMAVGFGDREGLARCRRMPKPGRGGWTVMERRYVGVCSPQR